jgi:hypothetical protein
LDRYGVLSAEGTLHRAVAMYLLRSPHTLCAYGCVVARPNSRALHQAGQAQWHHTLTGVRCQASGVGMAYRLAGEPIVLSILVILVFLPKFTVHCLLFFSYVRKDNAILMAAQVLTHHWIQVFFI